MHATASNSARASLWEWAQVTLLGANLVWTTLCFGGYRPEEMVVTSALSGGVLFIHFVARALEGTVRPRNPGDGWLLLFLGYAAINVVAISPVPWLGWRDWLGWANLIATFSVVLNGLRSQGPRRLLFVILVLLGVAAVVMGCYQRFVEPGWLMLGRHQANQFLGRASGPFGIPNSLAAYLLLLLPAAGALAFRPAASMTGRTVWGGVTAVFALGLVLTLSRGAWIGLALALGAWPMFVTGWRWRRRAGATVAVLVGLLLAGVAVYRVSPQVRDRIVQLVAQSGEPSRPLLWQASWRLFVAQPLTGSGGGSYNVLFERHRPKGFIDEPQWAHNDYLNTLSDYGAVGFGLFFGAGLWIAWRGRRGAGGLAVRDDDWFAALAANGALGIGVLAFALQLFVDFHFKIPALAMSFAVCAALALPQTGAEAAATTSAPTRRSVRWWNGASAIGVGVLLVWVVSIHEAEALRNTARQTVDAQMRQSTGPALAVLVPTEARLERAVAIDGGNGQAWSDLAFVREMQALADPKRSRALGQGAELAARRSLAISPVVAEFWIRLGVALDMQLRSAEARVAFERARDLAPNHSHVWYYYAFHLARDTKQREASLRAVAACLSLDPGNAAAEALRAKLNVRP